MPFVKAVQGIIFSALCVPGLVAPVFAQTMEQSLYREGYDAVRANDQERFQQIRARHPRLAVMVRTRDESQVEELQAAGALEVVPETLEAGLMIASQALLLLDVPMAAEAPAATQAHAAPAPHTGPHRRADTAPRHRPTTPLRRPWT